MYTYRRRQHHSNSHNRGLVRRSNDPATNACIVLVLIIVVFVYLIWAFCRCRNKRSGHVVIGRRPSPPAATQETPNVLPLRHDYHTSYNNVLAGPPPSAPQPAPQHQYYNGQTGSPPPYPYSELTSPGVSYPTNTPYPTANQPYPGTNQPYLGMNQPYPTDKPATIS